MKLLNICSFKDAFLALPISARTQLMEAQVAWINQQKKTGTLLEIYNIPGWQRTIIICEHSSVEEYAQTLLSAPGAGLVNFEVYPLADYETTMKAAIGAAKAAEQMSSGPPK